MGYYLPYADSVQDRQWLLKFAKLHNLKLIHVFSRSKGNGVYSLGRQTDIILNNIQHNDFVRNNEHFVYDVPLSSVAAWTSSLYPEALMCYRDLKLTGPRVSSRGTADRATFVQPNQVVIADSIPETELPELYN